MIKFDEEFDGVIFPEEKQRITMHAKEELILAELMFLTDCYRLNSRLAMTEFVKRIFLCFDSPLHSFVDSYTENGVIFSLQTPNDLFNVTISTLKEWIGAKRKVSGNFEFINSINNFKMQPTNFKPKSFKVPLRKDLSTITQKTISDCETVALFFTDMINETLFRKSNDKPKQYMREAHNMVCLEQDKAVLFQPYKELSSIILAKIELKIGSDKLICKDEYIDTTKSEKLEEIIRLAYGIKHGYINQRGSLFNYSESVDPYYFFSLTPVMNVFLNSNTFFDLYHYYSMYEWIDLLPQEANL